jgi:nuclear control of ATPase protein 2
LAILDKSIIYCRRKTERLLVSQLPISSLNGASTITPLTSGLLLLSVTRLRFFAETYLLANSRFREVFLEDVGDLEDPRLGREEKLRVVDRMWRCWSEVLGWRWEGGGSGQLRSL